MDSKPKKRGRPPGARNKVKPADIVIPVHAPSAQTDYKHSDPDSLVSRLFLLIDWQLSAAKESMDTQMKKAAGGGPRFYDADYGKSLVDMANALVRSIDALKKSSDIAEELQKRLTPQQLLEIALRKIEGQDVATINYAIKRLAAYRKMIGPITVQDKAQLGTQFTPGASAVDALASLEDDE
jgi:vacuolar-type H+-ATPase subunit I/STV1